DAVRLHPGDGAPGEADVAGPRLVHARDHVEHRGLAGAVGPDHADDIPVPDLQVQLAERLQAAKRQRETIEIKNGPVSPSPAHGCAPPSPGGRPGPPPCPSRPPHPPPSPPRAPPPPPASPRPPPPPAVSRAAPGAARSSSRSGSLRS